MGSCLDVVCRDQKNFGDTKLVSGVPQPVVLIDARMVGAVLHGIARYVLQLSKGLAALQLQKPLPYEPAFLVSEETELKEFHPFRTVRAQSSFLSPSEWLEVRWLARREKAALYHSPSFMSLPRLGCTYVVTVHDLNHLQYGSSVQRIYYEVCLRFLLCASAVVSVSDFSRQEVAQ